MSNKNVDMEHLWEVEHDYYCNDGNYFSNDCGMEFNTWSDFLSEFGDSDFDMNLLFRWDWKLDEHPSEDKYYRDGNLHIY